MRTNSLRSSRDNSQGFVCLSGWKLLAQRGEGIKLHLSSIPPSVGKLGSPRGEAPNSFCMKPCRGKMKEFAPVDLESLPYYFLPIKPVSFDPAGCETRGELNPLNDDSSII
ncbi:hypothetical protein XENOCAPTIV_026870 [Xenoophorus captivus]|uniref:Uncharacterized protein n=1 Tax=Xenoophorus captivus TaxID=1517983 RepID=A0ABV0RDS2_9TELE